MYLQITTKCNMFCQHCCYSCSSSGKHGDYYTIIDGIAFIREYGSETISIGGGEPTLHPRFFDILKCCFDDFNYVWLATNGSQTDIMFRLADIIDGNDMPEYECTCDPEDLECDDYECECYQYADSIYQENKLSVALSQDYFHDPIDDRVVDMWTRRSNVHKHSNFEIRDVTKGLSGVIAQGRAKRTGSGWNEDDCACPDIFIRPNGTIKLCGCTYSPIIGDVRSGITSKWKDVIQNNERYQGSNCYKSLKKRD